MQHPDTRFTLPSMNLFEYQGHVVGTFDAACKSSTACAREATAGFGRASPGAGVRIGHRNWIARAPQGGGVRLRSNGFIERSSPPPALSPRALLQSLRPAPSFG